MRNNRERLGKSSLAKSGPTLKPVYETDFGRMYIGSAEEVLSHHPLIGEKNHVQLIFTSPPFPLNRKKKYGNKQGEKYIDWLAGLAGLFRSYLRENGSIVMEMGNAWEPGKPVMSTLAMKALLAFQEEGKFHLCQELISHNPARLPSPAQWVNVERIRLKDSFTRLWWMSPSDRPKADNRRVLKEYSESMKKLLKLGKYNHGKRPSEHKIGEKSFLKNNGGAIPGNVLTVGEEESIPSTVLEIANTRANDPYQNYCRTKELAPHPARMPLELPLFFIKFLTEEDDLVLDSFAGSNTTGEAAEFLHRRWISIEASPEYAESSRGRFQQLTLL